LRLDPKTGKQTAVSRSDQAGNLFVNPAAVAVESATSILVTDFSAFGGPGGVIRVDPVTGAQTAVSPTGTSGPSLFTLGARGLAIGAAGSLFALNQSSPPEVIRIAEATGQQTLVTENGLLHGVDGIGLTPYGKLVVGNSIGDTGSVVRVDPGTGKQSKVAHGGFLHAPDSVLVASARPLISRFSISRSKFRVAKGATALVARLPRGATFSYRCSEAATIAMRIKRVGRNGHLTSIGKLVRTAQAGRNQLVFTGRIGSRKLNPGTYEALIRASVPYAPVSAPRSLRFSIVR
jgi:hypothetical protein